MMFSLDFTIVCLVFQMFRFSGHVYIYINHFLKLWRYVDASNLVYFLLFINKDWPFLLESWQRPLVSSV